MLGQFLLPFKRQVSKIQLMAQTLFIGRFQQSRSKCLVNFYGSPDDSIPELIDIHFLPTILKGYFLLFVLSTKSKNKNIPLRSWRLCGENLSRDPAIAHTGYGGKNHDNYTEDSGFFDTDHVSDHQHVGEGKGWSCQKEGKGRSFPHA